MDQNQFQDGLNNELQNSPQPMEPIAPPQPMEPIAPPQPMEPIAPPQPMEPTAPPLPIEPMATAPVGQVEQPAFGAPQAAPVFGDAPPNNGFDTQANAGWDTAAPPAQPGQKVTTSKPINRLALIGFCLAVGSWFLNYFTFCLMGIAGVVVSVLAMKRMDKEKENYPWMPIAGIAIGALATVVDAIIIISILGVFGLPMIIGILGSM